MKNMDLVEKSLVLLDKFFEENSKEYIDSVIAKIDNLDIEGPTFEEYIDSFKVYNEWFDAICGRPENVSLDEYKHLTPIDNICQSFGIISAAKHRKIKSRIKKDFNIYSCESLQCAA